MLRLKLMPLVRDFGETLHHPLGVLRPQTHLVFTRDYRIFGQFSNFPDDPGDAPQPRHIIVRALLPELKIVMLSEGEEAKYTRTDQAGYEMAMITARHLKTLIIPEDASFINKAIKAYINELANETFIILGWL